MRSEPIEEVLVQYLLGNLSEADEVEVEDRAFANAEYLDALEAVEADLIDAYVSGGLSQIERRSFERRFLVSPNRRSKVEFARALARITSESSEPERPAPRQSWMNLIRGWSPALRFAAGFAAVVCIAVTSWLTFQNAGMRSQIALLEGQRHDLETQEQGLRRQLGEERARAVQRQPSTGVAPVVASLVLLSNLSRAETRVEQLVLARSAQI